MAYKRQPTKGPSAMERAIPKNSRFAHIQSSLDTGSNVNKVKTVTAREYAKRRFVLYCIVFYRFALYCMLVFIDSLFIYKLQHIALFISIETKSSIELRRNSSQSYMKLMSRKIWKMYRTTIMTRAQGGQGS